MMFKAIVTRMERVVYLVDAPDRGTAFDEFQRGEVVYVEVLHEECERVEPNIVAANHADYAVDVEQLDPELADAVERFQNSAHPEASAFILQGMVAAGYLPGKTTDPKEIR